VRQPERRTETTMVRVGKYFTGMKGIKEIAETEQQSVGGF
jgi:hypothetical protein